MFVGCERYHIKNTMCSVSDIQTFILYDDKSVKYWNLYCF